MVNLMQMSKLVQVLKGFVSKTVLQSDDPEVSSDKRWLEEFEKDYRDDTFSDLRPIQNDQVMELRDSGYPFGQVVDVTAWVYDNLLYYNLVHIGSLVWSSEFDGVDVAIALGVIDAFSPYRVCEGDETWCGCIGPDMDLYLVEKAHLSDGFGYSVQVPLEVRVK